MIGYLALLRYKKKLGKNILTTEDVLIIFQEKLLLRVHILTYWILHKFNINEELGKDFPVLVIIKMLNISFQDKKDRIKNININNLAYEKLWKIFRFNIDSVLTRKDLLKKYPDLLKIEIDFQNNFLTFDQKKAIHIFECLENEEISKSDISKNAIFVIMNAPDNDMKQAVKVILNNLGISI